MITHEDMLGGLLVCARATAVLCAALMGLAIIFATSALFGRACGLRCVALWGAP